MAADKGVEGGDEVSGSSRSKRVLGTSGEGADNCWLVDSVLIVREGGEDIAGDPGEACVGSSSGSAVDACGKLC